MHPTSGLSFRPPNPPPTLDLGGILVVVCHLNKKEEEADRGSAEVSPRRSKGTESARHIIVPFCATPRCRTLPDLRHILNRACDHPTLQKQDVCPRANLLERLWTLDRVDDG